MAAGDGGTYEVIIARYGTRTASRREVFLNYEVYGEADGRIEMDYFFWVIRNRMRTVVLDTGFSRAEGVARGGRTILVDPMEAFRSLGVHPADRPVVVVSHAHYDHIGNLDHFDESQVVIAASELEFWNGAHGRRAQFRHAIDPAGMDALNRAAKEGRVLTFEDHHHLAPGIEIIRVGGHTPGQSMVRVLTTEGWVLLASDAIHYYEEYERDMPSVAASSLVDMYAAFDSVRQMESSGQVVHLVTGHDPRTFDRFVTRGTCAVIGSVS
jgi:glyoxylase-like metal-dependent hydrolase (beta-lactamase superfamily II)